MKLLVINGPNLNLLGLREPAIYGSQNYESLLALIRAACDAEGIEVGFAQSNHEGAIVDAIQAAYGAMDGIVINIPGFLAGLDQDAYISQFVPVATEETTTEDEELPGDEFGIDIEGDI